MSVAECARCGRNPVRVGIGAGIALLGIFFSGLAAGQPSSWTVNPGLQDRWTLEVGAYAPNVKTTAHFDSTTLGVGTSVNFEQDLGLDDRKVNAQILGRVRLGERWRIEAEYFGLNRSATNTINRTINWGGNIYPIGICRYLGVRLRYLSFIRRLFVHQGRASGARRHAWATYDGFRYFACRDRHRSRDSGHTGTASDHWLLWVVRVHAQMDVVGAC